MPSTRIDGVCLWLNADAPVIALSLRYDRIDAFWHTLLHECAHVKYKDGLTGEINIDTDLVGEDADSSAAKPEAEVKADEFASGFSIPKTELGRFHRSCPSIVFENPNTGVCSQAQTFILALWSASFSTAR